LKASLGSEQYQSMNSRMAWSYERFELADVRLFKTADFDSRSGNLRTLFGTRLPLLFAIGSGLECRGEKRDPVPVLLTSSVFSLPKLLRSKETSRLFSLRASQASVGAIGAGLPRPRSTMTTSRSPSASTISRGILCSGPSSTRSANP
jgi:hypothetical protein